MFHLPGRGIGSRIAGDSLPFSFCSVSVGMGRETVFAQMIPPQYAPSPSHLAGAALSISTDISSGKSTTWNRKFMNLTIRDDLTGLYKCRFQLLAEQPSLANERMPFSVPIHHSKPPQSSTRRMQRPDLQFCKTRQIDAVPFAALTEVCVDEYNRTAIPLRCATQVVQQRLKPRML